MKSYIKYLFLVFLLLSCSKNGNKSDAYGNFEAVETIISSESAGKLILFEIEEGSKLTAGKVVGIIDTVQLWLSLKQLEAQKSSIGTKFPSISAQLNVLKQQKEVALKDKERIEKMFAGKAATQKQVDDINGAISVIDKQLLQIETQNSPVFNEIKSIDVQIEKAKDLLKRSVIINPMNGIVLNKFAERFEIVNAGKPLYKIADLEGIILRVYVSGAQLSKVKIGQTVKVLADKNEKEIMNFSGEVTWISSQAEFTPKIIQTKDERVNMVYAVKVLVKNNGTLKIGMPGEVIF